MSDTTTATVALPLVTVPATATADPDQFVAFMLIDREYAEGIGVGDRLWHPAGYVATVTSADWDTLRVFATATHGRRVHGTVEITDGSWLRAPMCDYCDQHAARHQDDTVLCTRHARAHYEAWQSDTQELGVRFVRRYVAELS